MDFKHISPRATCYIWDTDYNSDNWEPEFMTIFVTWQLIVTLNSIRNYCDVFSNFVCFSSGGNLTGYAHRSTCFAQSFRRSAGGYLSRKTGCRAPAVQCRVKISFQTGEPAIPQTFLIDHWSSSAGWVWNAPPTYFQSCHNVKIESVSCRPFSRY